MIVVFFTWNNQLKENREKRLILNNASKLEAHRTQSKYCNLPQKKARLFGGGLLYTLLLVTYWFHLQLLQE